MDITKDSIVGQLVAEDYRMADVFKNFGIDFCCNGDKSISSACEHASTDPSVVISKLEETLASKEKPGSDYNSWPLDLLAEYIEKRHHRYVSQKVLEIAPYLQKIATVHGSHHPELAEVEKIFKESAGELAMHMKKEELMLFPAIKKMVSAEQSGQAMPTSKLGSISGRINDMMKDHDGEGDRFKQISELTKGYQVPEDGCNTYRVTLAMLKEFEEDLHLHIHLENNILFPKSIELEKKLSNASA